MELRQWNELPDRMRTREVRKYYNIIAQRRGWFRAKRVFDVIVSLIMLVFLAINDIDLKYTDKVRLKRSCFFQAGKSYAVWKNF